MQTVKENTEKSSSSLEENKICISNKEKFGWDCNAWIVYANQAKQSSIENARKIYEEFLEVFPTAVKYWELYIEQELNAKNYKEVEKLLERCLLKYPHVDLWQCYLNYCRLTTKNQEDGTKKLQAAFEFALANIKYDCTATPIWKDYIDFLQNLPCTTLEEQNIRSSKIRETFEQAIDIPLLNSSEIWDKYVAWLNIQSSQKLANKKHSKHSQCRVIYRERKKITDNIPKTTLALPPGEGSIEHERDLVKYWKKLISYERGNPQKLSISQLRELVEFTYKQCILDLLHFPEIWYEYAKYYSDESRHEEALKIYETAIEYLPDSILMHLSYADYLEQLNKPKEAQDVYSKILKTRNETLVWIQYMFFTHRVSGKKKARKIFFKAQKEPTCTYHIYVASAMLEYFHNKETELARKIFKRGFDTKFGNETEFIVHYLKFLWNLNEIQNTRAMFERVLSSLSPEDSKMIWNLYIEFEYQCGDAKTISHLEKRKADAFPTEDKNGILALVNRHRYQNLWPCDIATLDSFEISENVNVLEDAKAKKQEELSVKFPRPNFEHMLPFRRQMGSISHHNLGVPLDIQPPDEPEIIPNVIDDKISNLPDALVDFIDSLPKNIPVEIPLPNIDTIINYIETANLPPLQDASVTLGKRRGTFDNESEPPTKKHKSSQDAWRKRQAELKKSKKE